MMALLLPLHGKGGNLIMTKPRPPSKKFKAEAVSAELTVSAKLDIRAIIGTNGTNVPIKAQVM